jgi:hypothetical protein
MEKKKRKLCLEARELCYVKIKCIFVLKFIDVLNRVAIIGDKILVKINAGATRCSLFQTF